MQNSNPIHDLFALLKDMRPQLAPEHYVFATMSPEKFEAHRPFIQPAMMFEEQEGITLILSKDEAEVQKIAHEFECQRITLHVHSALQAVGFMAAIAAALKEAAIPCNVVAGYYHDHLFIPIDQVESAMLALNELSQSAQLN